MLTVNIAAYRTAALSHISVRAVDVVNDKLEIKAQSASGDWVLVASQLAPGVLPVFHLKQPSALIGKLAHVNYLGQVCFIESEGLSVDLDHAGDVLCAALSAALSLLERSLMAHRAGTYTELSDELEGYWLSMPTGSSAQTHLPIDGATREIDAYIDRNGRVTFADRRMAAQYASFARIEQDRTLRRERALYIPLTGGITLPTPGSRLTVAQVKSWAEQACDRPTLDRLLKTWRKSVHEALIIFSQPRSDGSLSAIAVRLKGKGGPHPLLKAQGKWTSTPLIVQRHAPNHLRARGGAEDLSQKRVAIIGAGSVGGHIADQLAHAGLGKLTVVDPESLEPDNIYRHVLGSEFCGAPKAHGIRLNLQYRLPGVQVASEVALLETWLETADLDDYDGIVIAIGVPSSSRIFNRTHWGKLKPGTPWVTTWLEPQGLGGHAQLTRAGRVACLECLYTDPDGSSRLSAKIAYTEPGQHVSRNLTGCGGAFTPYGNLDAVQTAALASRLLLTALHRADTKSYATWRGTDQTAQASGIKTTSWYSSTDPELADRDYARVRCPVCGGCP